MDLFLFFSFSSPFCNFQTRNFKVDFLHRNSNYSRLDLGIVCWLYKNLAGVSRKAFNHFLTHYWRRSWSDIDIIQRTRNVFLSAVFLTSRGWSFPVLRALRVSYIWFLCELMSNSELGAVAPLIAIILVLSLSLSEFLFQALN